MKSKQIDKLHVLTGHDPRLLDKDWRINHLYKVKGIENRIIPFVRNRAQRKFNEDKHNRNIILKSRRLGFTTDEAIDSLDDALFVPNTDNLILSYDQRSQLDIFDNKVSLAWGQLSPALRSMWTLDAERANKLKFNFGDGSSSSITVLAKGRGGTFSRAHVSEFGKICRESPAEAREIISGTVQAVPMHGRVDIESTAEGDTGLFHDMFWEAYERGDPTNPSEYKAHFFNWTFDDQELEKIQTMDPSTMPRRFKLYQEEHTLTDREITYYYLKWLSLNKDWDMLHQEYPTTPEEAFVNSGGNLFSIEKLNEMKVRDGEQVGDWLYFADYKPGHRYGLGADPSEGVGQDNATIAIVDFDAKPKAELVALYVSDRIAPDNFAYEIRNGGTRYGNCIVAVERNNHGFATLVKLRDIYFNIFKEIKMDTMLDSETERIGFHATAGMNAKIAYDLSTAINEDEINVPDKETVDELKTFPKQSSSKKDSRGKHWDRAKSLMIAYHMKNFATGNRVVVTSSDSAFDAFSGIGQF